MIELRGRRIAENEGNERSMKIVVALTCAIAQLGPTESALARSNRSILSPMPSSMGCAISSLICPQSAPGEGIHEWDGTTTSIRPVGPSVETGRQARTQASLTVALIQFPPFSIPFDTLSSPPGTLRPTRCPSIQLMQATTKSRGVPPGSMGWPFLGESLAFLKPHRSNSIGAFLESRCSRYGTVFKSHLFGSPAIVSCDLALNNFILQNEGKLFQSSYPKAMHSILGETSMLLVTGMLHKKIRSIVTGFIGASKSSPHFLASIQTQTLKLLKEWEQQKEIAFQRESKRFAFTLTVMLFMSIEPEDPLAKAMMEDFLTFMQGFISFPIPIPGTTFYKALKARKRLFAIVQSIIRKRQAKNQRQAVIGKGDYVDLVLTKDLKEDEKVTSVLDMLLGSHETTATLMALIVYFLEKAPRVVQALKDEHQAIRDNKGKDKLLNWEDYQQMEFTQCVIWEALRIGNVVKFVHRKATTNVKYNDHVIPSGWKVLPIFTATHLDPSLQDDPTTFNPWRWMSKDTVKRVTPFGGGLRLCPGGDIAKVEICFFLHHFLLHYGWRSKGDEHPLAFPFVEFQKGLMLDIYKTN